MDYPCSVYRFCTPYSLWIKASGSLRICQPSCLISEVKENLLFFIFLAVPAISVLSNLGNVNPSKFDLQRPDIKLYCEVPRKKRF
jgi:hypothetical protein